MKKTLSKELDQKIKNAKSTNFLENDFISKPTKRKKGKWGNFADRMSGLTTPEITEHIKNTSKEMKNSFEFRDLTPSN